MHGKTKILFVCVENAGRSQMAEAFFRQYAPKSFQAISAGTKPASEINPVVASAMKEIGIEMDSQKPKLLSADLIQDSFVVNMGCMDKESCPALHIDNIEDWQIPDPKGKSLDEVREIRDKIKFKVKELIKQLEKT